MEYLFLENTKPAIYKKLQANAGEAQVSSYSAGRSQRSFRNHPQKKDLYQLK